MSLDRMLRVREAEKYWMPVANGYGLGDGQDGVVGDVVDVVVADDGLPVRVLLPASLAFVVLGKEERMKLLGMSPSPAVAVVLLFGNTKAQKSMTWLPCGLISLSRCPDLRAT